MRSCITSASMCLFHCIHWFSRFMSIKLWVHLDATVEITSNFSYYFMLRSLSLTDHHFNNWATTLWECLWIQLIQFGCIEIRLQTRRKLLGFYRTEDWFWPDLYGKPFRFLFSISRYRELFPDIGNLNCRYREIIFRYREIINFPISGNDFRISGIDFPISENVFDFPISGNQFPISENRHPTEAGHFATLHHRPTTPINNGPQQYRHHRRPSPTPHPPGDRHYDFSKSVFIHTYMQNSISATNNNHTTDYFVQKYRNFWCWINVLNDINKNSTLR